ncbi:MAG: raffinose/stachyose/melibiose transport system permease protein [Halanaerobiales bacterium]|nr:raffinose/stachyose/melibiose transport system permease protein [Halanaerobiales bacterium]
MRFIRKRPYILFILPGFILYTAFVIYPLFSAMSISLYEWTGIGPKKFVGLANFVTLFFNPRISEMFWNALKNNFFYVLAELGIIMPLQILLAYLIFLRIKGYRIFQTLIFLPCVISTAVIGFFIMIVFDPNFGILNSLLKSIGLGQFQSGWFGDPDLAFPLFIVVATWVGIGYGMMLFIANLKGIPEQIIEASIIDGAGGVQRFFRVILPQLWPSLTNIIVLDTIWGLTIFDIPFIIGGPQGGVNNSLDFMNIFFYRYAFGNSYGGETAMGFGASISVVLFGLVLIVSIIQIKFLRNIRVEY